MWWTLRIAQRLRPLTLGLLCIFILSLHLTVFLAHESASPSARWHSVDLKKVRAVSTPPLKNRMQDCRGLAVASAYYKVINATVHVEMTTGFRGRVSYTPFLADSVRCMIDSSTGSFLVTEKHYSHCQVPIANVSSSSLRIGNVTVRIADEFGDTCALRLQPLMLDARKVARYAVSALTTVQNSETYFREWVNYLLRTGWSHAYVYDDGSSSPMKALLSDLSFSGFITYIDWSHSHEHTSRQYMAMQDFLIQFRHETQVVAQMDDDCYYVAKDQNGNLVTDVASTVQQLFERSASKRVCQLRAGSYWFGHGWVRQRTKPLALSSTMRANTSLGSARIEWKRTPGGKSTAVDSTLSLAKTDDIHIASGITHKWDMKTCRTNPISPPTLLYFHHYKVKPWHERKVHTKAPGSWGHYNEDETFWESTASQLHQVNDMTMELLNTMLNLSAFQ